MPIDKEMERAINKVFPSKDGMAEKIAKLLEDMQTQRNIDRAAIFQRISLLMDDIEENL